MWAILTEVLPLLLSTAMTAWMEYKKQQLQDFAAREEMYIRALDAKEQSVAAAREFVSPGSSWSRKFIVQSVIGALFLFPMVLTVLNWGGALLHSLVSTHYGLPWHAYQPITIYIPQEIVTGGLLTLFYSDTTTQYIPITGFVLLPIHILMAQCIGGFYFGQGVMRRISYFK